MYDASTGEHYEYVGCDVCGEGIKAEDFEDHYHGHFVSDEELLDAEEEGGPDMVRVGIVNDLSDALMARPDVQGLSQGIRDGKEEIDVHLFGDDLENVAYTLTVGGAGRVRDDGER